jgi:hypothetical protein
MSEDGKFRVEKFNGQNYQLLFLSLYLRLRSTVSRHPKVGKRWRREKRQPSAKETKEYFFVGVVWLPTVPG